MRAPLISERVFEYADGSFSWGVVFSATIKGRQWDFSRCFYLKPPEEVLRFLREEAKELFPDADKESWWMNK